MTNKLTRGVHHIGLNVPDLEEAGAFFCGRLGFDEVGGVPDSLVNVSTSGVAALQRAGVYCMRMTGFMTRPLAASSKASLI